MLFDVNCDMVLFCLIPQVETLVMSCGREYLYSAPAIDARAVSDAATCFRLLPDDCAAAAQEMVVIALLKKLPSLGVSASSPHAPHRGSSVDSSPHVECLLGH
jgi:hypothetical protein